MASYSSIFGEADYGCGEQGSLSAQFDVVPVGFAASRAVPGQAEITFACQSTLTVSNVKYSTTTDQDVSAWVVLSSPSTSLAESAKTFVPREDCTSTTNTLSSNVVVKTSAGDTVRAGGRWSGFEDDQTGISVPGFEWVDLELDENYTITPPQNLQVTFTATDANISNAGFYIYGTIDSWSTNPNINGEVISYPDGTIHNNWNWKIEFLNSNGFVEYTATTTSDASALNVMFNVPYSSLTYNADYRVRMTASNSLQATTSVMSPVMTTPPADPVVRRVTPRQREDGDFDIVIDYAVPVMGGTYETTLSILSTTINTLTGAGVPKEITRIQHGASVTGTYVWEKVISEGRGGCISFHLASTSGKVSAPYKYDLSPVLVTPAKAELTWSDDRTELKITPKLGPTISYSGSHSTFFQVTVELESRGSRVKLYDSSIGNGSSVTLKNLSYQPNDILYIKVTPRIELRSACYSYIGSHLTYNDLTYYATVPLTAPVLGVVKTCDETKNIVDIVEAKLSGEIGERWLTGKRIVTKTHCEPGGGIGEPGAVNHCFRNGEPDGNRLGNKLAGDITIDKNG